jgi:hypothetical protein
LLAAYLADQKEVFPARHRLGLGIKPILRTDMVRGVGEEGVVRI